jgi:hypothetical protein
MRPAVIFNEATIDAAIEEALDRVLGGSFFAKPKQTCVVLGISLSTYNRAVRAGFIQPTPRGDYQGASRSSPVDEARLRFDDRKVRRLKKPFDAR